MVENNNRRLDILEKIVLHGNGEPSIVSKVSSIETQLDIVKDMLETGTAKSAAAHDKLYDELKDLHLHVSKFVDQDKRDQENSLSNQHGYWIIGSVILANILSVAANYFLHISGAN